MQKNNFILSNEKPNRKNNKKFCIHFFPKNNKIK